MAGARKSRGQGDSSIPLSEWDSRYSSLKMARIINEPSASAAALRLHTECGDEENKILVIDFGGGTFDVSLVEYFCSSNHLSSKSALVGGSCQFEPFLSFLEKFHLIPRTYTANLRAMLPIAITRTRMPSTRMTVGFFILQAGRSVTFCGFLISGTAITRQTTSQRISIISFVSFPG